MALADWAVPQLSKILPLDAESAKELIAYTETLSKDEAAEHLKDLLGDSPQAFEFIAAFNSRRQTPAAVPASASASAPPTATPEQDLSEVPRAKRNGKKGSKLNKLPPPRRPDNYGDVSGGYIKQDEQDYMKSSKPTRRPQQREPQLANTLALQDRPDALQVPLPTSEPSTGPSSRNPTPKPPPSAAGPLVSDTIKSKKSRPSSPAPSTKPSKTKVSITGGTPMHGGASLTSDLDLAIRALEAQTNPSLTPSAAENARRRCNCMATRHPLLDAAPNCLNCGKIVCVKEGLGPCTFCEKPLLSGAEIQAMVRALREERGKERMEANNAAQRRADVSQSPRPFANLARPGSVLMSGFESTPASSNPSSNNASDSEDASRLQKAKEHRDRLLSFQSQNARRTTIRDEAADFDTPTAGLSMWASPQERALQLKRQQKILREQEWSARPEWEKRRVVASIDVVGGRVVKRMESVNRPESPASEDDLVEEADEGVKDGKGGAFSRNPLLGGLIRPTARGQEGQEREARATRKQQATWRRVQDDETDNEQWILDGGAYGGRPEDKSTSDEPICKVD